MYENMPETTIISSANIETGFQCHFSNKSGMGSFSYLLNNTWYKDFEND